MKKLNSPMDRRDFLHKSRKTDTLVVQAMLFGRLIHTPVHNVDDVRQTAYYQYRQ